MVRGRRCPLPSPSAYLAVAARLAARAKGAGGAAHEARVALAFPAGGPVGAGGVCVYALLRLQGGLGRGRPGQQLGAEGLGVDPEDGCERQGLECSST